MGEWRWARRGGAMEHNVGFVAWEARLMGIPLMENIPTEVTLVSGVQIMSPHGLS